MSHIYEFSFNFDTVFFYQFLETETLDRTNFGRNQLLKCLGFTLPFYLISPFNDHLEVQG